MFKSFFIFIFSVSLLHGELDTDNDAKKVKIKGEALSAHQVLEQVQSQLDVKIQLDVPDTYGFKQAYDHHVTLEQVIQAIVEYYRDFNKVNLELLKRGKHRIILRERLEQKPEPVPTVEEAKKRVEAETQPKESGRITDLEEPVSERPNEPVAIESTSDPVIAKLKFEVSDLVSLETQKKKSQLKSQRKLPSAQVKSSSPKLSKLPSPPVSGEKAERKVSPKPQPRVLQVELVGNRLVDLDDDVLRQKTKTNEEKGSLEQRLNQPELQKKKSFISDWKKRETSEWNSSPVVELGYFGAASPWQKPTLLSYRSMDSDRGQLKVGLGTGTSEEISQPFDGIDVRSEKLLLSYERGWGEEFKAHVRGGLLNHDGELAVGGVVYNFESTGLSDIVVGFNYIPQSWTEIGNLSFGLDINLPTGDDADFAGSGGLDWVTSAGYHTSVGRWRGQTQFNLSFLSDYDAFTLESKSTVFSCDLGVAYYFSEMVDWGLHLHWSETPWETSRGVWGKDSFYLQTAVQTLAWTDPVSFYVDVGLSGAAPDFGIGLQWLKDFQ